LGGIKPPPLKTALQPIQQSGEGIATNILADRPHKLEANGIITAGVDEADGRRINYRLTEKGIDLGPVLLELRIWGARHEETGAPCALIGEMERNREEVLAETRRQWRDRDSTPLLPKFEDRNIGRQGARSKGSKGKKRCRGATP